MKKALIAYNANPHNDEWYTPAYAVEPLLEFIPKMKCIWESTDYGDSAITEVLKEHGKHVISSHIERNENFFTYKPDEYWDMIVTNPPYSIKDEFLARAYELGRPFAMLLPVESLGGQARFKLYKKYGLEILVLDKRVEFSNQKNPYFSVAWFCHYVLPEKLIFREIDKK